MNVTNIKIYPYTNATGAFIGNGEVVFEDFLSIRFSIMKSASGIWISWPQKKGQDSEGKDKWYADVKLLPIGEDDETKWTAKYELENQLIKEYNATVGISASKKEEVKEQPKEENAESKKTPFTFKRGKK